MVPPTTTDSVSRTGPGTASSDAGGMASGGGSGTASGKAQDTAPGPAMDNGSSRPAANGKGSPSAGLSTKARKAILLSLVGNGILFGGKLALGWRINSLSVVADAFHSLSDSFTTLIVLLGLWGATKAPDEHHPFGHGRAEYIGTLVLAVLLVVAGFELGRAAFSNLWNDAHHDIEASWAAVFIILMTVGAKEAMARYVQRIGQEEASNLLGADALHHRMDALTSLGVALGLMGALAGYPVMDDLLGLVVAGVVVYSGLALGSEAASLLLGREPSAEMERRIAQAVLDVEGVSAPHRIWVHDYGTSQAVTLHVGVDAQLPLGEAHKLADEVERRLKTLIHGPIMVHLDPEDLIDEPTPEHGARKPRA